MISIDAGPPQWVLVQAEPDTPPVAASGLSAGQLFALADQAKSDGRDEDALAL